MIELPDGFAARVIDVHGKSGQAWLADLSDLIRDLEHDWSIGVQNAYPDSNYNYVAPAVRDDGSPAVLKLSVPGDLLVAEATTLKAYGGLGAPNLLEQDLGRGALLMERISPGIDISDLPDSEAIAAIVEVMEQLHQAPVPDDRLPTVSKWGEGFDRLRKKCAGETGPLPVDMIREAEDLFHNLASTMGPAVLLHGDLHHMNILSSGDRSWLAIDPQGVIGERAYEIGAFLRNPMPTLLEWPDLEHRQKFRISEFSKRTGVSEQRIASWGYSQAVLSAIWSLEDHDRGWEIAIQIASVLRNLAFA